MHHRHEAADAAAAPCKPWTTLVLVVVAQFMVILDVTVVNVALPSIGTSLGVAGDDLQWVVTAYVLFTGGLMLLGGRLSDLAGRRTVFLLGLGLFTAASLASGLAWSAGALIASRALQGAGAALLLPSALAIVSTTYEGRQRTRALAVWGVVGSAGAAAGLLVGGVLTQALGWEAIFFVNVPVGLAVALAAPRVVARAPGLGLGRGRLDVAGAVTLMAGLVALVLAADGAGEHGWTSARTLGLTAGSALLLGAFARLERRVARPLVAPAIWRVRSLVSGAAVMLVATGLLVGAFFLNTVMLQGVMGATPIETGLAFLPIAVMIMAGAHVASQLLPRAGSRPVVAAGLALVAGGALLLAGAPAVPSYAADLLPGFLVIGLGVGLTFVAVSVAAMADVGHEQAGLASGLMTTAHELGAALGVSALAAVAAAGGASGYGDGFTAAAVLAAAAAALAALRLPSVRPRPGMAHGIH